MPPSITKQNPPRPSPPTSNGPARPPTTTRTKTADGSAWDLIDSLRIIVYGESGSGKTTFASTFPGRSLWLVCSGGNRPGELRSIDTPENRQRIDARVVRESSQLRTWLDEATGFDNLVLDHVSGLADLILKEILGLREIPAQKGWGLATQQQYGQMTQQSKEYLRAMLNLPMNVIIIAQQRTFGGRDDGVDSEIIKPTVGPAVTPSLCGWLAPACDYVLQMFKRPKMVKRVDKVAGQTKESWERGKGVEYCARTEPHETYMTKFRVPRGQVLPDVIVDPDYAKLLKLIRGK